ncbi:transcriptional activator of glycolytic enzymes-domain-containing protein [Blakeslea trispora]|nr:transcriptional activator of glycolytic enzymes-domain-containing protein [Blakeslea trispora]
MSREVVTVAELWEEWTVGRDGFWSVEELDSKWGSKWRGKDRKWINIRKKVVNAVKDLMNDLGLSAESAINCSSECHERTPLVSRPRSI